MSIKINASNGFAVPKHRSSNKTDRSRNMNETRGNLSKSRWIDRRQFAPHFENKKAQATNLDPADSKNSMDGIRNNNNISRLWHAARVEMSNGEAISPERKTISRNKTRDRITIRLDDGFTLCDNPISDWVDRNCEHNGSGAVGTFLNRTSQNWEITGFLNRAVGRRKRYEGLWDGAQEWVDLDRVGLWITRRAETPWRWSTWISVSISKPFYCKSSESGNICDYYVGESAVFISVFIIMLTRYKVVQSMEQYWTMLAQMLTSCNSKGHNWTMYISQLNSSAQTIWNNIAQRPKIENHNRAVLNDHHLINWECKMTSRL
jgi:hypothetical protein